MDDNDNVPIFGLRELTTEQLKHNMSVILELLLQRGEIPISMDIVLSRVKNFGKDNPSYWGNALAGETGELCNIIKKWDRDGVVEAIGALAMKGRIDERLFNMVDLDSYFPLGLPEEDAMRLLRVVMGDEMADIIIYIKLMAKQFGIDLNKSLEMKVNHNLKKHHKGSR